MIMFDMMTLFVISSTFLIETVALEVVKGVSCIHVLTYSGPLLLVAGSGPSISRGQWLLVAASGYSVVSGAGQQPLVV